MSSAAPKPLGLSPRGALLVRRITVITVTLLALGAAVMSFAGLRELAINAGYDSNLAWLFPLIVDGLVVTGSLGVVAASLVGLHTWYPWMLTWIGVIVSVVGNVAVANDDFLSRAVHATPPIVFALAIEGLIRIYRVGAQVLVNEVEESIENNAVSTNISESAVGSERSTQPNVYSGSTNAVSDMKVPARDRLREILISEPEITGSDAARRLGIDPSHARKLLRDLRDEAQSD